MQPMLALQPPPELRPGWRSLESGHEETEICNLYCAQNKTNYQPDHFIGSPGEF